MQRIGRAASRALLQRLVPDGMAGSGSSLQQLAGFAKKSSKDETGGDSRMQKLLRALEPAAVEDLQLSPEDAAEAERRCACESTACKQWRLLWLAGWRVGGRQCRGGCCSIRRYLTMR